MIQRKQSVPHSLTGQNPYVWIRWWYTLVAPRTLTSDEELPLKEREFLRRGKLTSIALLINLVISLLEASSAQQAGQTVTALLVLITIFFLIISLFLNRVGKLLTAGILMVSTLEMGILSGVVTGAGGMLSFKGEMLLIMLIQPLMVSVLLFPAWGLFVVGAFNIVATIVIVLFLPRALDLQIFVRAAGPSALLVFPILGTIICALISFVMITSLQESMARADKAEEVNKLHQVLSEQTRRELQTKQQLEVGIQEIVTGMSHFSNGDLQARIQLERGHVLWSVASSINNLIGRFVRVRGQGQEAEKTYGALQSYLTEVRTAKVRGASLPPPHTGTPVDAFVEELVSSLVQQARQSHAPLPHSQADGLHTPAPQGGVSYPPHSQPQKDKPYTSRI